MGWSEIATKGLNYNNRGLHPWLLIDLAGLATM